jgi:hypothetical protein
MNPVHHSISIANSGALQRDRVKQRLAAQMALRPISNLNSRASFLDL